MFSDLRKTAKKILGGFTPMNTLHESPLSKPKTRSDLIADKAGRGPCSDALKAKNFNQKSGRRSRASSVTVASSGSGDGGPEPPAKKLKISLQDDFEQSERSSGALREQPNGGNSSRDDILDISPHLESMYGLNGREESRLDKTPVQSRVTSLAEHSAMSDDTNLAGLKKNLAGSPEQALRSTPQGIPTPNTPRVRSQQSNGKLSARLTTADASSPDPLLGQSKISYPRRNRVLGNLSSPLRDSTDAGPRKDGWSLRCLQCLDMIHGSHFGADAYQVVLDEEANGVCFDLRDGEIIGEPVLRLDISKIQRLLLPEEQDFASGWCVIWTVGRYIKGDKVIVKFESADDLHVFWTSLVEMGKNIKALHKPEDFFEGMLTQFGQQQQAVGQQNSTGKKEFHTKTKIQRKQEPIPKATNKSTVVDITSPIADKSIELNLGKPELGSRLPGSYFQDCNQKRVADRQSAMIRSSPAEQGKRQIPRTNGTIVRTRGRLGESLDAPLKRFVQRHELSEAESAIDATFESAEMLLNPISSTDSRKVSESHPSVSAEHVEQEFEDESLPRTRARPANPPVSAISEEKKKIAEARAEHVDKRRADRLPWKKPMAWPNEKDRKRAIVEENDLTLLESEEYLNDNLVSLFLRYAREKADPDENKIYCFSSFFFPTLTRNPTVGRINYESVENWTRKVNIFEKDYVVIPICQNWHWYTIIVCNLTKVHPDPHVEALTETASSQIEPVDDSGEKVLENDPLLRLKLTTQTDELCSASAKSTKSGRSRQAPVRGWNPNELVILTLDSMGMNHPMAVSAIKQYIATEALHRTGIHVQPAHLHGINAKGIPIQTNGVDCALYMCAYIERFMTNPDRFVRMTLNRSTKADFWPNNIESWDLRDRMYDMVEELHIAQEQNREPRMPELGRIMIPLAPPASPTKQELTGSELSASDSQFVEVVSEGQLTIDTVKQGVDFFDNKYKKNSENMPEPLDSIALQSSSSNREVMNRELGTASFEIPAPALSSDQRMRKCIPGATLPMQADQPAAAASSQETQNVELSPAGIPFQVNSRPSEKHSHRYFKKQSPQAIKSSSKHHENAKTVNGKEKSVSVSPSSRDERENLREPPTPITIETQKRPPATNDDRETSRSQSQRSTKNEFGGTHTRFGDEVREADTPVALAAKLKGLYEDITTANIAINSSVKKALAKPLSKATDLSSPAKPQAGSPEYVEGGLRRIRSLPHNDRFANASLPELVESRSGNFARKSMSEGPFLQENHGTLADNDGTIVDSQLGTSPPPPTSVGQALDDIHVVDKIEDSSGELKHKPQRKRRTRENMVQGLKRRGSTSALASLAQPRAVAEAKTQAEWIGFEDGPVMTDASGFKPSTKFKRSRQNIQDGIDMYCVDKRPSDAVDKMQVDDEDLDEEMIMS